MEFNQIASAEDVLSVGRESSWQDFERLVGFIFEENGFDVSVNVVKVFKRGKKKKRRQYDVVAKKPGVLLVVDCKKWAGNRYRLGGIKSAVSLHRERTRLLDRKGVPLIVTLIEEEISVHDGVTIVPVEKLNSYLREADFHKL